MEFKSQTSQPAAQPAPQASRPAAQPNYGGSSHGSGRGRLVALLAGLLVVLALVGAGLYLLASANGSTADAKADPDKYQAVFMTNGQVYFGHLASTSGEYVELTDIYYLQVQSQPQTSADKNAASQVNNANSQVSLTKLGSELHGPTDKMHISKDQVLFWEDLKADSSVVKAIDANKNKQ